MTRLAGCQNNTIVPGPTTPLLVSLSALLLIACRRRSLHSLQTALEGCSSTIASKKACFKASTDPSTGPTDGTWDGPKAVKFADGSSSKTRNGSDYPTTFAFGPHNP